MPLETSLGIQDDLSASLRIRRVFEQMTIALL